MKKTKQSKGAYWFFILFGAAFFLPGLYVFTMPASDLAYSARAQMWQAAQAQIISVELTHEGSERRTYEAKGEYSYEWEGQSYTSKKIMFNKNPDSQRKYQGKVVRKLEYAHSKGRPVDIWVNPRKPSEAVIYRGVRWGKVLLMFLFSLIFMGAGGGIMWLGHWAKKAETREIARQDAHPNEPWKWRNEWQTKFIKNNNRAKMGGVIFLALFWNAASLPLLFIIPEEILEKKNYIASIALAFPLVGVGFIVWAVKMYQQARRFKHTGFELETYPAALGHYLRGILHITAQFPKDTEFNVTLKHIHKYQTGSGETRSNREVVKWQDGQHIPANAGRWRETYELPIFFALPEEGQSSNWSQPNSEYFWRLEFKAELAGADYQQEFVVPVFDPKTYPKIIPADLGDMPAPAGVYTYKGDWTKTDVVFHEEGDGTYYYFPPARHIGSAISLTVMALVFGGIGLAGFFTPLPLLFTGIFGIPGIFLAYGALNFWLFKSAVEISDTEVTLRRGLFRGGFEVFNASDFSSLNLTKAMRVGDNQVYHIIGHLTSGKTIKLAKYFIRKRDAESLVGRLSDEMGLTAQ